jgi:hypothetical protein
MRRFACLALLICLMPAGVRMEEEYHYTAIPPRPALTLALPAAGASWGAGGTLVVSASGSGIWAIEAVLAYPGGSDTFRAESAALEHTFTVPRTAGPGMLTVTAYGGKDENGSEMTASLQAAITAPRDKLIADMLAEAKRNSTDKRYIHAPAQEDYDIGVCKNFVMRLFDTCKDAYAMLMFPDLALHMPKNKSKAASAPYDYGIEWRPETAAEGSPFEVAAQFKYDTSLSREQNEALCRGVLESVLKGDFFQMAGNYYYGNGPHSLLFMADYEKGSDMLHWTDSNMKGDRVNGARWGYLQYDASRTVEWFVKAICTRNRGCTLYRLRDDLFIK